MSNPREGQILNLMKKHKMTRRQATVEYKRLMRLWAMQGGKKSTYRPFTDPEVAREAQAKSVEKRKLNKEKDNG